jgi:hypothetical protein
MTRDWRAARYFGEPLYLAMARSAPAALLQALRDGALGLDAGQAMLSLLRSGYPVPQADLWGLTRGAAGEGTIQLAFYIDDEAAKLGFLDAQWRRLEGEPYMRRCWRQRDIVNAPASFPTGVVRLDALRRSGQVDFVTVKGILFGTLRGSGVRREYLTQYMQSLAATAEYIAAANRNFGGREPVLYVDVSPDLLGGEKLNEAGWSDGALYMTSGFLRGNSPRAASFTMLHETCEQRYLRGSFSAELGRSYVGALRDGSVDTLRLGRRIGGAYADSGLGHPWDSEREWLAESASAAIIGEPVPPEAQPALRAVCQLFAR